MIITVCVLRAVIRNWIRLCRLGITSRYRRYRVHQRGARASAANVAYRPAQQIGAAPPPQPVVLLPPAQLRDVGPVGATPLPAQQQPAVAQQQAPPLAAEDDSQQPLLPPDSYEIDDQPPLPPHAAVDDSHDDQLGTARKTRSSAGLLPVCMFDICMDRFVL